MATHDKHAIYRRTFPTIDGVLGWARRRTTPYRRPRSHDEEEDPTTTDTTTLTPPLTHDERTAKFAELAQNTADLWYWVQCSDLPRSWVQSVNCDALRVIFTAIGHTIVRSGSDWMPHLHEAGPEVL